MAVSLRSSRAQNPGLAYWGLFQRALQNVHSTENENGIVSFCVAENALRAGSWAHSTLPTQISTQTWSWSLKNYWFLQINWNGYICIFDLHICTGLFNSSSSSRSCCFQSSRRISIDLEINWIVQFNLCLRGKLNAHIQHFWASRACSINEWSW